MNVYEPKPIDTSDVTVSEEIMDVAEQLARNTHEVWAKGRRDEGWVYGETLDREKKVHPLLVPYEELPESEKDYDRRTSLETLKLLLKLGYRIQKDGTPADGAKKFDKIR